VRAIESGWCDIAVAGGVESMSTTPAGATLVPGAQPFGPSVVDRYRERGGLVPPGTAAEAHPFSRAALDAYARRSHERAAASGFDRALVAVGAVTRDELPRAGVTDAELAAARPAFVTGGTVTAMNSAGMADGAAALVLVSERLLRELGRPPLARVVATAEVGADPLRTLEGAVPAARAVLERAAIDPADVGRIELAEPFAALPLLFAAELDVDEARLNPAGGGIAMGEPTGAVGARLLASLAHGLGDRFGLAAGVATGGLGAAVLLERVATEAGS
jgi:acetyl-CoA acetyltransferase family protein